jgi:RNA polymerase sigma-70 factor (ECF subfamily)
VEAGSFTGFYLSYYQLLLTVAHQRLGSLTDAEDATAEVFRVAWQAHVKGTDLSLAWAYQTLRNVVGNEYRRRSRADALAERVGIIDSVPDQPGPLEDAIVVRQRMEELSSSDRELIRMAYWEDLSRDEIAEILGCSAVTVRVRLLRARNRLDALLKAKRAPSALQGRLHG